jgi:hypothetical protein
MNRFLASLDNNATPPVNPSSTTGNVPWPSPFYVHTFTAGETTARTALFGSPATRLLNFTTAIQLLWVVEHSVISSVIAETDPVITYTETQLVGQFAGVGDENRQVTSLALISTIDFVPDFLSDRLANVYYKSMSRYDRLAALIAHFGMKTPT